MLSPASVKGHGLNKDNDEDGAVAWMDQRGDLQPVACGQPGMVRTAITSNEPNEDWTNSEYRSPHPDSWLAGQDRPASAEQTSF